MAELRSVGGSGYTRHTTPSPVISGADLKGGDGDGTSSSVADDALKPRVDFLYTAFLWLAGIMVTGILALLATMLTLSGAANTRTDRLSETVSGLNREVGTVGSKVDDSNRRLDRIESKIDALSERMSVPRR